MWIWQEDSKPFISCDFDLKDQNTQSNTLVQSYIRFSQDSSREFVTTGKKYLFKLEPFSSGAGTRPSGGSNTINKILIIASF